MLPSVIRLKRRLVRSEAWRRFSLGTQRPVSASDEIECEVRLALLALRLIPAPASTSDWDGGVLEGDVQFLGGIS